MLYQIAPLAVLIAALVTFGVLNRNSEIVAMKATGISLYRLVVPIVSIAAPGREPLSLRRVLSAPGQSPAGGAAQHHQGPPAADLSCTPSRSGSSASRVPASPARIFYYQFFDPDAQRVRQSLRLRVRSLHLPLSRRIFAKRAIWDSDTGEWLFENGWVRDIEGANVTAYRDLPRDLLS